MEKEENEYLMERYGSVAETIMGGYGSVVPH
jgi:hypothetical protein